MAICEFCYKEQWNVDLHNDVATAKKARRDKFNRVFDRLTQSEFLKHGNMADKNQFMNDFMKLKESFE